MILHGFDKVQEWINFACVSNGCSFVTPLIRWEANQDFTRRMGDANYRTKLIRLSVFLFARATEEQRRETVIHEACHIIACVKHGYYVKAHGYEWRECMHKAGLRGDRCHKVDRSGLGRKVQRCEATCRCGNVTQVTPMVAGRITHGWHYFCRRCKGPIEVLSSTPTYTQTV